MQSKFRPRNSFYLRISKDLVLPVYVYLDEEHIEWMSEHILQHVLSDLHPKILHKLKSETEIQIRLNSTATSTMSSVDTHRGDTYQFCYFLRKSDPHAAVIKKRQFRITVNPNIAKKPRLKDKTGTSEEVRDTSQGSVPKAVDIQLPVHVNEELEKPKPRLQLNYQGYKIYGYCLCIVVEPWPPLRRIEASERTYPSTTNSTSENQYARREKTPLFLPEEPEEWSNTYLFPDNAQQIQNIDMPNTARGVGMLEFSQILRNAGSMETIGLYDEDEIQSGALFGDADEDRELHS